MQASALLWSAGKSTRETSEGSPSIDSRIAGSWCEPSFLPFSNVCEVITSGTEIQPGSRSRASRWSVQKSSWRRAPSILGAKAS